MKKVLLLVVCLMMFPLISQADDDYYCVVDYSSEVLEACEVGDVIRVRSPIEYTVIRYCDLDASILFYSKGADLICRLRKPREERK
jgi:hypothetical protein